ncbi:signal peptide-containing protein [Theileria equi strain WA]|uniref:Signal peptide-containing protein n=1 Tax=Theileria equi strain WA TaxID=1537102 RepID=L0AYX6_THEEQ|nr:signal peptide-containing protein [Theileria equi strain WA]AFZ80099.1 signal peptide-containing protein [Theileria equi strain WA]|eukprot:XP_004829765.1 signal peptide-containing protein [Theileria equi strain WA]
MKVLSVLWTICLVRLCHGLGFFSSCCGGDVTDGETLDLANPDSSKVDVGEETSNGIRWKVFTPKNDAKFTSFTEGRVEIAKTNCGLKCLKISLNSQTPLMIVERVGACTPAKYFEKVDEKWKEISDHTLCGKLNAISKNTGKANEPVNTEGSSNNIEDE